VQLVEDLLTISADEATSIILEHESKSSNFQVEEEAGSRSTDIGTDGGVMPCQAQINDKFGIAIL
jgi:hypothetical protein